jgi:FG-GAP repeat/FG-GAP-like repeat
LEIVDKSAHGFESRRSRHASLVYRTAVTALLAIGCLRCGRSNLVLDEPVGLGSDAGVGALTTSDDAAANREASDANEPNEMHPIGRDGSTTMEDASAPTDATDSAAPSPACDVCPAGNAECRSELAAPRLIAPLSTATATSQTPLLHWALAPGEDGAQVEICHDRACTMPVTTFVAHGTSGAPGVELARGVYFWRVSGTADCLVGTQTSAVWEFFVGARSAPVNTAWGTVLDVDGDGVADVAVGAYTTGFVDVYLGGAEGLSSTPLLLSSPDGTDGQLGAALASAGDVNGDGFADLVVGAPYAGPNESGNVYVYLGGPHGLYATPIPLFADGSYGSAFGTSVASAGDVNGDGYADVVAASGNTNERVYVSLGGPDGMSTPTVFSPGFAYQAVSGAGDINGDGFGDVVIAPFTMPGNAGTASVYLGGPGGLSKTSISLVGPGVPAGGPYRVDSYGAVACAGDVNGDGYADILVGGSGDNAAYLYFGSPHGPSAGALAITGPGDVHGGFGSSVAGAGDVNADGLADIVIGQPFANEPGGAGAAYVYFGVESGLSSTPVSLVNPSAAVLAEAGIEYDLFGMVVAGGGDVNGDGFDDVVVGAYDVDRAYLFLGSAAGPSAMPSTLKGAQGRFGGAAVE